MKALHMVTFILLIIGGINWLLVGLGGWNVVDMVLTEGSVLARIVYILVGISAVIEIFTHKSNCNCCTTSSSSVN